MRILVYEMITGGGCLAADWPPPCGSLLDEGLAMLRAVVADFSRLPEMDVAVLSDRRLGQLVAKPVQQIPVGTRAEHDDALLAAIRAADRVMVIAPETDGWLEQITRRVEAYPGKLLSSDSRLIQLAADKWALARYWQQQDVPTPETWRADQDVDWAKCSGGCVLKLRDGAGSQGMRTGTADECRAWLRQVDGPAERWIVQPYVAGRAASCVALAGPVGWRVLHPCWQMLSPPNFVYHGGELIQDVSSVRRAQRLTLQALNCLPVTQGIAGVDLILGDDPRGTHDLAMEVNPRLTTSYVGLRDAYEANLMEILLAWERGEEWPLPLPRTEIRFDAAGNIHKRPPVVA